VTFKSPGPEAEEAEGDPRVDCKSRGLTPPGEPTKGSGEDGDEVFLFLFFGIREKKKMSKRLQIKYNESVTLRRA
jgi:hypothetical protein